MVFCVIADGPLKDLQTLPECDVAVFGFNGLGEVDYEQELKGVSDKFEDAVRPFQNGGVRRALRLLYQKPRRRKKVGVGC